MIKGLVIALLTVASVLMIATSGKAEDPEIKLKEGAGRLEETAAKLLVPGQTVCSRLSGTGKKNIKPSDLSLCEAVSGGFFCPLDTKECNPDCPYGKQLPCLINSKTQKLECSPYPCVKIENPNQYKEMPTVFRTFSSNASVDKNTGACLGTIYIFSGKGAECTKWNLEDPLFDCCGPKEDHAWFIEKNCAEDEKATAIANRTKKCHRIGDRCLRSLPLIGCTKMVEVYCCFSSKLARIIHEQGRPQLKNFDWGSPENPRCEGLTQEQFQFLDFSKIDLSEFLPDIQEKFKKQVTFPHAEEDINKNVQKGAPGSLKPKIDEYHKSRGKQQ